MLHIRKSPFLLKNIVAGVTTECFMKGHDVSPKTVELVVRNNLYNPDIKISYNMETRKQELKELSDACVAQLCSEDRLLQKLLSVQTCFLSECGGEEHIMKQYDCLMEFYLGPMVELIISTRVDNQEEMHILQDLIVKYTVIWSGVGHPNDTTNLEDARAALLSIFSYEDLQRFCIDKPDVRRELLHQLALISTGIRLFNKSRGKSEDQIEDFPTLLSDCLQATSCVFLLHIEHCRQKIRMLHKLMDGCIVFIPSDEIPSVQLQRPKELSSEEYHYAVFMLIIQQQIISYLRSMYFDIKTLEERFQAWLNEYTNILVEILGVVQNKVAVPTRVIYPMFVSLSLAYSKFYRGILVLSNYEKTLYQLTQFFEFNDVPEALQEMLKEDNADGMAWDTFKFQEDLNLNKEEMTNFMESLPKKIYPTMPEDIDSESGEQFSPGKINPDKVNCEVVFINTKDIKDYDIMYGGFDPVCIVEGEGLVLEVEPEIGLLKYKGMLFGFTCNQSAYIFGKDPKKYFGKILDFVRLNPMYIEILHLRSYLDFFLGHGRIYKEEERLVTKRETGVQTALHLYECNIDEFYQHSKWKINKIACKLADLAGKKTVSCQSKSYFREDSHNQSYGKKDAGTVTMRDGWSNTSTPAVFRYGLRGKYEGEHYSVSLSMPIMEPHVAVLSAPIREKKEQEMQTMELDYFDKCSLTKIKPRQDVFYQW